MSSWYCMARIESCATIYTRTIVLVVFVPRHPRPQTCLARSPAALTRDHVARIAPHRQYVDDMCELSSGVGQPDQDRASFILHAVQPKLRAPQDTSHPSRARAPALLSVLHARIMCSHVLCIPTLAEFVLLVLYPLQEALHVASAAGGNISTGFIRIALGRTT